MPRPISRRVRRWWQHLAVLTCATAISAAAIVAEQVQPATYVRAVLLNLSNGQSFLLEWRPEETEYSVTVPDDAPLVAVRCDIALGETAEEEAQMFGQGGPALALHVPAEDRVFPFLRDESSAFVSVGTDAAKRVVLTIAESQYTIFLMRSRIASNGQGVHPDPAMRYSPRGTLSGLSLWDSLGNSLRMASFLPRLSFYLASVGESACDVRLAATPNDPDAELRFRLNGGKWDYLVPGMTSSPVPVNNYAWTLLEVEVRSAAAAARSGNPAEPLIYQVALTKEMVCHPKCHTCFGSGPEDCLSCLMPLVLHSGRCLYTACNDYGVFFDPSSERCERCHADCLECEGPGPSSCILCQRLRYLLAPSVADIAGRCVETCPPGFFVRPSNLRCEQASAKQSMERFFIRLELRISVDEFLDQQHLVDSLLIGSAETLAVSREDVHFVKWEIAQTDLSVGYFMEVQNPFLRREDVRNGIPIDKWFAILPVPVDDVWVLSAAQLYPTPYFPPEESIFKPWMFAVLGGVIASGLVFYPMYHYYFMPRHFQMTPYVPRKNDVAFLETVLQNAPEKMIHALATEGAKVTEG
eukprot:TRINITY_DN63457_c0_g1_i1.p1 TRINITY_DN63457_c0_g1~~TRINITY_DN63457_c0_g1_i1.p1  ORF type:complete len:582 (+),score=80.81 TRINITY_DN63457_c0_g1_i1:89-1834(+)